MREITSIGELYKLKNYLKNTFKSTDPFGTSGEIFSPSMTDRLILCPTFGYRLDERQFDTLIMACKTAGIYKVYFSEVEGFDLVDLENQNQTGKYLNHYYELDLSNENKKGYYDEYTNMELILENAIYTATGNFGVLISHEDHAVFGGTKQFTDHYKLLYQEWNESRKYFEDLWAGYSKQNNTVQNWFGALIKYIYP